VQFENEFSSPATADAVFKAMMDVRAVATCLPGATIGEETEDGAMQATVAVKVGPIRMTYGGTVRVEDVDAEARTATMRVSAREQRGQGGAEATVALEVEPQDGGSRARMSTELAVTGRVAQMGAGVMQEVANSMVSQFADCLSSRLAAAAPPPPQAPVNAAAAGPGEPTATAAPEARPAAAQPASEQSELRALPLVLRAIGARIRALFKRG
jgi:carbon monoxide dehydrogenase subunit G